MYGMVPPPWAAPKQAEASLMPEYAQRALNEHLSLMRQINQKLDRIEALLRQR
ncbi:MAG: hypothetical protein M0Z65_08380 [Firmicutes bacterium]|uniref:Uncharacterized protein n=1 Tax=Melghirimyces thermohalophilus TaxID=1236220 RepID=A0A1G6LCR0_9BACL|nr:hypothetical protein [Melghirimyces thermohalophilus]MDA8353184.1 hypothetical protein [Bacillota bacterium]SDC40943.1 hypothetical protein SAMN04488112_107166 [Melghirimyces thermohalophilus]